MLSSVEFFPSCLSITKIYKIDYIFVLGSGEKA